MAEVAGKPLTVKVKAKDLKLNRTVALKFLPERLNASAQDKAVKVFAGVAP